jgi:hypothetical protein
LVRHIKKFERRNGTEKEKGEKENEPIALHENKSDPRILAALHGW